MKWTGGNFAMKFSRFRWTDEPGGPITYIGDKAEFQNDFGAYTWLDDSVSTCVTGACDLYTDLVSVPEPTTWVLMIIGCGLVGAATRRRRAAAIV